jgi:predicted metalloenzyme YecM
MWALLRTEINDFSDKLNAALAQLGILDQCKGLKIDHICVRLKHNSDVNRLKAQIVEAGRLISTANVNGREIAILQLHSPIMIGPWKVSGVEMPYPKLGHAYEDGWEHVEFVLNGAANTMDGVRQAFTEKFPNLAIDELRKDYGYCEDAPLADGDQIPNPTLGIKINGVGLKFHAHPIQVIVGHEKQ